MTKINHLFTLYWPLLPYEIHQKHCLVASISGHLRGRGSWCSLYANWLR